VRVAVAVDPEVRVTFSLSSDESKGNGAVESKIVPANPPTLCTEIVVDPLDPEVSVKLAGLDEIVKSGDNPGPRGTPRDWGDRSGVRVTASIIGTKHTKKANKIATSFLEEERDTKIENSCRVRTESDLDLKDAARPGVGLP